jgi:hypothetical protein
MTTSSSISVNPDRQPGIARILISRAFPRADHLPKYWLEVVTVQVSALSTVAVELAEEPWPCGLVLQGV